MIKLSDLRINVPSIFAAQPAPHMSDRYAFVSTYDLVEPLLKTFEITGAVQRATRKSGRDPRFTRHELRLRPNGVKKIVGGVVPEVVIVNSHDGQSRISITAGLYRFVCANGLTVPFKPGSATAAAFVHLGDRSRIVTAANAAIETGRAAGATVRKMMDCKLSPRQLAAFAKAAALSAYGDDWQAFDPALLLAVRRPEDEGNDVWTVMNRLQENILRGGVSFESSNSGRTFATRGITHIGRRLDFNNDLWTRAAKLAKAA